MQVNQIQNNNSNPYFQGFLKIQNFNRNGQNIVRETSMEFDRGLADLALKNFFGGNWTNEGSHNVNYKQIKQYTDVLRQSLGINLPRNNNEWQKIELKTYDGGYSIKFDEFRITHKREDQMVWD